jgi:hypothetical protein
VRLLTSTPGIDVLQKIDKPDAFVVSMGSKIMTRGFTALDLLENSIPDHFEEHYPEGKTVQRILRKALKARRLPLQKPKTSPTAAQSQP